MCVSGCCWRLGSQRVAALVAALVFTVFIAPATSSAALPTGGHLTLRLQGNTVTFKLSFPKAVNAIRINFSPSSVIAHNKYDVLAGSTASGFAPAHCSLGGGSPNSFLCNTSDAANGDPTWIPAGTAVTGTIRFSRPPAAASVASADGAIHEPSLGPFASAFLLQTANASF